MAESRGKVEADSDDSKKNEVVWVYKKRCYNANANGEQIGVTHRLIEAWRNRMMNTQRRRCAYRWEGYEDKTIAQKIVSMIKTDHLVSLNKTVHIQVSIGSGMDSNSMMLIPVTCKKEGDFIILDNPSPEPSWLIPCQTYQALTQKYHSVGEKLRLTALAAQLATETPWKDFKNEQPFKKNIEVNGIPRGIIPLELIHVSSGIISINTSNP